MMMVEVITEAAKRFRNTAYMRLGGPPGNFLFYLIHPPKSFFLTQKFRKSKVSKIEFWIISKRRNLSLEIFLLLSHVWETEHTAFSDNSKLNSYQ